MTAPVLSAAGLVAGYERDLPIVRGVDLAVMPGEFVVVLGPNGAGKSTLAKAIAGVVSTFAGAVTLDGAEITRAPLHEKVRHGLAFVPQTENVFASLAIGENLRLAADVFPRAERTPRIEAALALFPDLASRPALKAGALSGGQRQMLAIARALVARPRVLILDEPSAGLAPRVVGEVFATLRTLNASGVAIMLIEQNVKAALAVAHRGVILVEGRVRHAGEARALAADPLIAELYLGARSRQGADA